MVDSSTLANDAALLGITLPDAPVMDTDFPIDAENWQAVMLFCRCSMLWRYGAMGGVCGLDYPGVNVVLSLTVPEPDRVAVFADVQVMERAAVAVLNKKTK